MREARREKLRELLDRHGLGALILQLPANFAWYTNGADNRVDHADAVGVAAVLLTPDAEYVLTDNIEAPRMREEELPGFGVVDYPWYGEPLESIRETIDDVPLGADHPLEGARDISEEITPMRYVLDYDAIERYKEVGKDASAAMEEAASHLNTQMDEHEAAAMLAAACRKRGLFTPVLIVAGEKRIPSYRHPIPRGNPLESRAMLAICAERGGLYTNLTRTVHFAEPDQDLKSRQEACDAILQRMREATVPGRKLSDAFEDCKKFYAEAGYPDEWQQHHQGGLTGYASREVIATPETHLEMSSGMAFAWNPSVKGAKSEDTFILTDTGHETITVV